jgi:hypothetical protein
VERARADLDVDRLLDHTPVLGPERLEREDQVLQVHGVETDAEKEAGSRR